MKSYGWDFCELIHIKTEPGPLPFPSLHHIIYISKIQDGQTKK